MKPEAADMYTMNLATNIWWCYTGASDTQRSSGDEIFLQIDYMFFAQEKHRQPSLHPR